jgi:hypothetical protein
MQGELKTQLEDAARENGRSLNSEIVARLEASFAQDVASTVAVSGADIVKLREVVEDLLKRVGALETRAGVTETPEASSALEMQSEVLKRQFAKIKDTPER